MRKLSEYNDQELMTILETDNSRINEIFNIIYKRYSSDIFSYCTYQTNNSRAASDICQETWIEFNQAMKSDVKIKSVKNLLFFIARKNAAEIAEQEKNSDITLSDNIDSSYFSSLKLEQEIFNDMNYRDMLDIIELAISNLKPEHKDPFILRKLYNYDYEVVARKCRCTKMAARQKVKRATESIYKLLEKYIEDFNLK